MRKILLLLPLVLVLLSANAHAVDLTTCTTINSPGYYRLLNDVVVDGEATPQCLILSSDVIFDCNGHWINTSLTVAGIQVGSAEFSRLNNVTVKNCKLHSTAGSIAALFENVENLYVENITSNVIERYNFNNVVANITESFGYHTIRDSNVYVNQNNVLIGSGLRPATQYLLYDSNLTLRNYNADSWYEGAFISVTCNYKNCSVDVRNVVIRTPNMDEFLFLSGLTPRKYVTFYGENITILGSNSTGTYRRGTYWFIYNYNHLVKNITVRNAYVEMSDWNQLAFIQTLETMPVYLYNVSVESFGRKMFVTTVGGLNLHIFGGRYHCNPVDVATYFISDTIFNLEVVNATVEGCTYAFDLSNVYKAKVTHSKIVHNTYGIFVGAEKVSGQIIRFWDNLFNNTFNHMFQAYPVANDVYEFNTTLTTGINVLGGAYIGGNYWGSPDGSGYSDMCIDNDTNGICDEPYVIINDPEAGVYLADYLPLSPYQVQPFAPPQLPEVRILNPVSEVYYSAYVPVDVVVVYNQSRYDVVANISVYVDGVAYGRCENCTELHKTIYIGGGSHVFEVYVPYELYENGSLVNSSVLYANSTFFVQFVPLQTQIVGAPGGGAGAVLSLVDVIVKDASYITYQNECVQDYLVVELRNAFDYCDVEITYFGEGLPEGMIKYPSEYTLNPGYTYIPIEVCGVAPPDIYAGKVEVSGLCGSDVGSVTVTVKSKLSQIWEFIMSPIGILFVLIGLWLWKERRR